jgi:hypothetical protein
MRGLNCHESSLSNDISRAEGGLRTKSAGREDSKKAGLPRPYLPLVLLAGFAPRSPLPRVGKSLRVAGPID